LIDYTASRSHHVATETNVYETIVNEQMSCRLILHAVCDSN